MANVWHNPLYNFENPFGTHLKTPNDTNSIVTMVHPNEIKRHLEEKVCETQRTLDAIYTTERENQHLDIDNQPRCEGHKGTCPHNPFGNNDGNLMPPRTPKSTMGTCPSPPKPSHHDSDEEITSEDVIRFQQDGLSQKLMFRALEENGDQYFRYMEARGWKLPQGFDFERIIHKREPIEIEILREEVQEIRKNFA